MADMRVQLKVLWGRYRFQISAVLVVITVIAGRIVYSAQAWDFGMHLLTEGISVGITVLILDELNRRRAKQESEAVLKRQLVDDTASIISEIAKNAVHQIRRKGWLEGEDGVLRGASLFGANLAHVNFIGANLQETSFNVATLQNADLRSANLRSANLIGANLEQTQFAGANLSNACLMGANLQRAALGSAKLQGAELQEANLSGAVLGDAQFDETTILPDWSPWSPKTDMQRFTDPAHPEFWRSAVPGSPTYRGKDAVG